ncbi:hypothetical protein WA026_003945 [Henosepilachna vigintioctopunctata]|uniref:Uncharacterized protein n=1 Tax=Henosepilachna vigintioctopunctata TaxID=420089 RepID=A0AAW1UDP6_9CUCU
MQIPNSIFMNSRIMPAVCSDRVRPSAVEKCNGPHSINAPNSDTAGTIEPHPESHSLCEMAHKTDSNPAHRFALRIASASISLRRSVAALSTPELCRALSVPDVPQPAYSAAETQRDEIQTRKPASHSQSTRRLQGICVMSSGGP